MFFFEGLKENKDIFANRSTPNWEMSREALEKYDVLMGDESLPESKSEDDESVDKEVTINRCPIDGHDGKYSGERGNSDWYPDGEAIPGDRNGTNPEGKTWNEIFKKYEFDHIPFKDGDPDFSEVSKGNVEIDDFSEDRDSNFDQADEKLAEQRGCTPEEVANWRKENGYTWHECKDCKTMQEVPTEVHGNVAHSGGISEIKSNNVE